MACIDTSGFCLVTYEHGNGEISAAYMQMLKGSPGAYNLLDDKRVVGRDHKEHDENLDKVMRKFEEDGLTLNYEKSV